MARPPSARRAAVAAIVVLGGVIGALALIDVRSADPADEDTAAVTTTTQRRRLPETTQAPAAVPPVTLPVSTGLRVVSFALASIRVTDLDTGEQTMISARQLGAGTGSTGSAVARGRGVVWVNPSGQVVYLPDLVATATIVELGEGASVVASDRADRVWIVVGDPWTGTSTAAREVDLTGRVMAGPMTFPPGVSVVGGVPGGLVVGSRDGIFVAGRDGEARRIARGTPVGTFADRVVHHACDANLNCDLRVTDVATGQQRRLDVGSEIPALDPWSTMVSPDGRFTASLAFSFNRTTATLNLYDMITGRTVSPLGPDAFGPPVFMAWSPDGQWLVVSSGASDRALRVEDGEVFEIDLPVADSAIVVTRAVMDSG